MKLFSYPLRFPTVWLSLVSRLCPAPGPEPAGGGGRQMLLKPPAAWAAWPCGEKQE